MKYIKLAYQNTRDGSSMIPSNHVSLWSSTSHGCIFIRHISQREYILLILSFNALLVLDKVGSFLHLNGHFPSSLFEQSAQIIFLQQLVTRDFSFVSKQIMHKNSSSSFSSQFVSFGIGLIWGFHLDLSLVWRKAWEAPLITWFGSLILETATIGISTFWLCVQPILSTFL